MHNRSILAFFNENLVKALKDQKGIRLGYGSEFHHPIGIANLIQNNGHNPNRFPIPPVTNDESTRKSNLSEMILCGNYKSVKMNLNVADLEKSTGKEVDRVWFLPLKIDLVFHINIAGVFPLMVLEQFSIKKKGEFYTKRRVTHD